MMRKLTGEIDIFAPSIFKIILGFIVIVYLTMVLVTLLKNLVLKDIFDAMSQKYTIIAEFIEEISLFYDE